jgi:MFS family permease
LLFSLPLFLQSVLGWSPLGAGGLLAALAMGAFVAAPTAAQLANRRDPRFVTRLGLLLEIVGIIGISLVVTPRVSGWALGLWLFVYGMGVGYASAQLTGLILSDVPISKSGQASGTQSAARQVGAAMGTAVLGTVVFVSLHANVVNRLATVGGVPADAVERIATAVEKSAGTIIPRLANEAGTPAMLAAQEAFADAVRVTGLVAAAFIALGLIATLALPRGAGQVAQSELIHDFE